MSLHSNNDEHLIGLVNAGVWQSDNTFQHVFLYLNYEEKMVQNIQQNIC